MPEWLTRIQGARLLYNVVADLLYYCLQQDRGNEQGTSSDPVQQRLKL